MNLIEIYEIIAKNINLIDFNILWDDFKPYRFALYNDSEVVFAGQKVDKTDQFIGNTSILYNNEQIAIWNVTSNDKDMDILTSKIVHEMFHAYQNDKHESRFPNEMEALIKYNYSKDNLNLKLAENKLLKELIESFDKVKFDLFLAYRLKRKTLDSFSFNYESSIEVIEGTALYIELQALYQLNKVKADKYLNNILNKIIEPNNFIPIRVISYNIGVIILKILIDNNITFDKTIYNNQLTYMDQLLVNISNEKVPDVDDVFSNIIEEDKKKLDLIIKKSIKEEPIVMGNYKLYGCNVYDARYHIGYLLSNYFIAYIDKEEPVFLHGDFIARMDEEFLVKKIYKMIK